MKIPYENISRVAHRRYMAIIYVSFAYWDHIFYHSYYFSKYSMKWGCTFNNVHELYFDLPWLEIVHIRQCVVYFIVLCQRTHRLHHSLTIRGKAVTVWMDLYRFFHSAREKWYKSIHQMTIFPLMGTPWRILPFHWLLEWHMIRLIMCGQYTSHKWILEW